MLAVTFTFNFFFHVCLLLQITSHRYPDSAQKKAPYCLLLNETTLCIFHCSMLAIARAGTQPYLLYVIPLIGFLTCIDVLPFPFFFNELQLQLRQVEGKNNIRTLEKFMCCGTSKKTPLNSLLGQSLAVYTLVIITSITSAYDKL